MKDYKPQCAHKSVGTDNDVICPVIANPKPTSKPKRPRYYQRHIGTQTTEEDQACLQSMVATSLTPYLQLRSSSPILSDYESDGEAENSDKVEWMFQKSHSSARCQAIRPQVRLLRVLKENLAKHRPLHYASKYKDILPDAVGWDSLGSELQNIFTVIFKLGHILEMLPLEPILTESRQSVVRSLTHLLSHLPFPNSIAQTVDMVEINRPRSNAIAAYLFGWKVKEVINLLRSAYSSEFSDILPDYFKAELCRADKVSYESLKFALQGMRNTGMPHGSLSKDFVSSSTSETGPLVPRPTVDWYGVEDEVSFLSCDSDSSSSDLEAPLPPKQVKMSKSAGTEDMNKPSTAGTLPQGNSRIVYEGKDTRSNAACPAGEGTNCSQKVVRKKSSLRAPSTDHQLTNMLASKVSQQGSSSWSQNASPVGDAPSSILQDLSMSQLVAMSQIVESQIVKIQSDSSEPCLIPKAVSRRMSTSRPSTPSSSSFHINVSSSGNVQGGKVLCNPIYSSPACSPACSSPAILGKDNAATGKSPHQNVADLVSHMQNRVRVQPLTAEESALRNAAKFSSMKQKWKLSSTGLPVWQPITTASTTANEVSAARQVLAASSGLPVWYTASTTANQVLAVSAASTQPAITASTIARITANQVSASHRWPSSVLNRVCSRAVAKLLKPQTKTICASTDQQVFTNRKAATGVQELKLPVTPSIQRSSSSAAVAGQPSKFQPVMPGIPSITALELAQLNSMLCLGPAEVVSKAPGNVYTTTTSDKLGTNSTQKVGLLMYCVN